MAEANPAKRQRVDTTSPPSLARIRVGTAGIMGGGLDAHQADLDFCEINSSAYGAPSATTLQSWAARSARGFRLGLKAPQTITHAARLDAPDRSEAFLRSLAPLAAKDVLGPVLFQTARTLAADAGKLRRLRDALRAAGVDAKVAVEFRHPSWRESREVLDVLVEADWALVSHPNSVGRATVARGARDGSAPSYELDAVDVVDSEASWAYVRLHGRNDEHTYDYSDDELRAYATQVDALRRRPQIKEVYVSFLNNDADNAMLRNAKRFRELVHAEAGEAVPFAPKQPRKTILSFFKPKGAA